MPQQRLLLICFLLPALLSAQGYVSYFTGDTSDVDSPTSGGTVLMGGATENDNAMRWFLQRANGGDVVVIRATGSDGYNDYLYTDLGVAVNSVQTLVTPNLAAALDPYVAQQIRRAEALWIAGGDQWNYVSYWKDGPVGEAIRYLIEEKKAVVGGTSAGMAVLGEAYFSAQNGTITSAEALTNPYAAKMALGYNNFLHSPFLHNLITDTHYDDPDRRGRHVAFLARLATDHNDRFWGIASEEYTAVCIDTAGMARVFGGYPQEQDYAYFLQMTCETPFLPENCASNTALQWQRGNKALTVCKVAGKNDGSNTFSLADWKTSSGGAWENWWVEAGQLKTQAGAGPPVCLSGTEEGDGHGLRFHVFPNPGGADYRVELPENCGPARMSLCNAQGQLLKNASLTAGENHLDLSEMAAGFYFLTIETGAERQVLKLCRR